MKLPIRCPRSLLRLGLALAAILLLATQARAGILDASWTAPTTNVDGSALTDLASYRVYYGNSDSPCPAGSYFAVAASGPSPAPNTSVSYRLTGLSSGTSYFVSVTAVTVSGEESDCFTAAPSAVARIDFAVSPTGTVDFGSVATGDFAEKTFTVQNTGGGTVTGTVSTAAPFSVVAGGTLSLVGVGASQAVRVRFTPTVAASASANVTFRANGGSVSRIVTGIGIGAGTDPTPPTVAITAPTSASTYGTKTSPLTLSGTASDNIGVTQVTWANDRGGSGTATGTTSWTASGIILQAGANVLTVTARDAAGNTATDSVTVTFDVTPPVVTITMPMSGSTYATRTSPLTLSGTASDNVRVTRVTWANDRGGSGTATGTTSWTTSGIILQAGANVLTVTARDAAGNTATDSVTVTFDVTPPVVTGTLQFSAAQYSTPEGIGAVITVERTGPAGLPGTFTVQFDTPAGGTAVPTTDYTPVSGTLTFAPGIATRTFVVPTQTNAVPNGPRTVNLRLRNVTGGAVLGLQSTAVLDLIDNDPGGQLFWSSANYAAREGAGLTWAIVKRTGGVAAGVVFDYATVDGTARAGEHYEAQSGTLTFAAGATQKNIALMVQPQNTIETGPLTFTVVLSNPRPTGFPNGATLGSPSVATVTIADDDEGGVVQFGATNVTIAEGAQLCTPTPPANACATVVVTRAGGSASQVTVDYSMANGTAISGTHYLQRSGQVTFGAAQTTTAIPVQLIDDNTNNGSRMFTLTLTNPRGGATLGAKTTVTVTIADND
ncbi:MAG TPA: Calx-beta domain-containing protein [Methylomirabilota bacterium]|jgi:hypothetical protein|nr:Calx-beta domain-containing protein [Methylomirabilota bacterium]